MEEIELNKVIQALSNSIGTASKNLKQKNEEISFVPVSFNITMPVVFKLENEKPIVRFRDFKETVLSDVSKEKTPLKAETLPPKEPEDITTITIQFKLLPGSIA